LDFDFLKKNKYWIWNEQKSLHLLEQQAKSQRNDPPAYTLEQFQRLKNEKRVISKGQNRKKHLSPSLNLSFLLYHSLVALFFLTTHSSSHASHHNTNHLF